MLFYVLRRSKMYERLNSWKMLHTIFQAFILHTIIWMFDIFTIILPLLFSSSVIVAGSLSISLCTILGVLCQNRVKEQGCGLNLLFFQILLQQLQQCCNCYFFPCYHDVKNSTLWQCPHYKFNTLCSWLCFQSSRRTWSFQPERTMAVPWLPAWTALFQVISRGILKRVFTYKV